jgi:hypothetical protein
LRIELVPASKTGHNQVERRIFARAEALRELNVVLPSGDSTVDNDSE